MEIIRLNGKDKHLYDLVAPLAMNPAVIRQNNGYPFKTTLQHVWYIAVNDDSVAGFMPLKKASVGMLIDNYYVSGDDSNVIGRLVEKIVSDFGASGTLAAMVFKRHVEIFRSLHFLSVVELKNYDKMEYRRLLKA